MVKNSKYIFTLLAILCWNSLFAQQFDAIKRDSEITRVTLENHFKRWDQEPLLNKIQETEANYRKGSGLMVSIFAPNSRIFLENGVTWSFKNDQELLDTFYDDEIISLQQDRLAQCLAKFISDFSNYLPQIENSERYTFEFQIKDQALDDEELVMNEQSARRHYLLSISISAQEIEVIKSNKTQQEEILNQLKIEVKPL